MSIGLITRLSDAGDWEAIRLRCDASGDEVMRVAGSISVALAKFLHDPLLVEASSA